MSKAINTISSQSQDGDRTTFVWKVGKVRAKSYGDQIKSQVIRVGEKSWWRAVYFPKGFTDPDYASVYVTNVDCELAGVDAEEPTKITKSAFATVSVKVAPEPRDLTLADEHKKESKEGDPGDMDDDGDENESAESASTGKKSGGSQGGGGGSKGKGSKEGGSKAGAGAGSTRSVGSRASKKAGDADKGKEDGGADPAAGKVVFRELSQLYTNLNSSWGFEKLLDIGKLYSWKEGFMNGYGEGKDGNLNKDKTQDGYILFEISILAVANIRIDPPRNDPNLTSSGHQRTLWMVHDIKNLIEKIGPNKKLSSSEFDNDGDWYFVLYPNGYHPSGAKPEDGPESAMISLFLHSTRKQVELGKVFKQTFRLGVKKFNPSAAEDLANPAFDNVYFPKKAPWGTSCVAKFDEKNRCFGKRLFFDHKYLTEGRPDFGKEKATAFPLKGGLPQTQDDKDAEEGKNKEFISGVWENKGAVCFVLEMLVTDEVTKTVQHMLHQIEEFGNKHEKCYETDQPLKDLFGNSVKVICYECGRAYAREVTNYQARLEEYGYEIGRPYLLDILMREEEHWLDKAFKTVNVTDKLDQFVNSLTKSVADLRVAKALDVTLRRANGQRENEEKQAKKEKARQDAFEDRMDAIRKDVEDFHFSRPVCSKCSTARTKITHPSTKVKYANQPPEVGMLECVDSLNLWVCPDQNAVCGVNYTIVKPENVRIELGTNAEWNVGKVKDRPKDDDVPDDGPTTAWDGNFRFNWKEVLKTLEEKYEDMDGEKDCRPGHPGGAMKKTTIIDTRLVLHAKDQWIFKLLPKSQKAKVHPNETDDDLRLRVAMNSPARNAMTLVRGSFYVEPLELTRQCPGRVNSGGIRPEEDEDAVRDGFCDVRFDVRNPPQHRYCLWDGKVYCKYCAADQYMLPLPEFEKFPDLAEPRRVSYQAKEYRSKTPIGRIQPVSEKPEEEPKHKRTAPIEEEEVDDDAPNPIVELLMKIPLCGKSIGNKVEELLNAE